MSINPKEILQDLLSGWTVVNSIGVGGFKEVFLVENDSRKEALKITLTQFPQVLLTLMNWKQCFAPGRNENIIY